MDTQRLVAYNLRRLRVNKPVSQENLAVDARIDRTYVSRLERGLENPTIAVLDRLASSLNASITEFFKPIALNEKPPQSLPGGRHPKNRDRTTTQA